MLHPPHSSLGQAAGFRQGSVGRLVAHTTGSSALLSVKWFFRVPQESAVHRTVLTMAASQQEGSLFERIAN